MARLESIAMLAELDGAVLVDKPANMASHDVVKAVKQHFNLVKAGHGGTLAKRGIQYLFPDSKSARSNLQKFIGINEIKRLFKAHDLGRGQLKSIIGSGCTGIGKLFLLADVQLDIFLLGILTDYHA